eukprot:TRINITY_DN1142_c0_g1_i1.p1 TRINITY_DN1142_c0_g1~~TRINITY_DN1142_c0_g1_i1.p1  ORF type:complete len:353 (-),score=104.89 TRINITY_DN1142_c0_g1_i1:413-1471(-)
MFGKKKRSPPDLVKKISDSLEVVEKHAATESFDPEAKPVRKAFEDFAKHTPYMKIILYGEEEKEPVPELIESLLTEVINAKLVERVVDSLVYIPFETRKEFIQLFNGLLRRPSTNPPTKPGASPFPLVEHIRMNDRILFSLIDGYEKPEISLSCGMFLRECFRHESLARVVLGAKDFYRFFTFVDQSNFDVQSDSFATFKDLLTIHKTVVAEFLGANFDEFFEPFNALLLSENYVTRRQSLKLLGELLLDRANFKIMTRYIAIVDNLKLLMNVLRDKSRNIQYEAFHVFKVFVANPNKPVKIKSILFNNKEKLVKFLQNFLTDKEEDEQFVEEKALLIREIARLEPSDLVED